MVKTMASGSPHRTFNSDYLVQMRKKEIVFKKPLNTKFRMCTCDLRMGHSTLIIHNTVTKHYNMETITKANQISQIRTALRQRKNFAPTLAQQGVCL